MTEVKEVWVEMWEFPKYEISNLGNVRNAKTEKKLAIRQDGKEYKLNIYSLLFISIIIHPQLKYLIYIKTIIL